MIGSELCYCAGLASSGAFVKVGSVSSLLQIEEALQLTDDHERRLAASFGVAALLAAIPCRCRTLPARAFVAPS